MRAVLPEALRHAADTAWRVHRRGRQGRRVRRQRNDRLQRRAALAAVWQQGDEIVVLNHGYGAVRNTVRFVAERSGARMVEAEIPFPRPDADTIVNNVANALTPRTRLAVIDHITSGSAIVLPLQRIIDACHGAGVPVLVDGAHAPAQVKLDMRAIGADWYAGNCHKWLCAPKGSAFLYAAPERQDDLHPVTISHGFDKGFREEFDWTGTRDPSAYLATSVAIEFHARLGGEALMARNITLAAEATALLSRRLNTEPGAIGALAGSMGVVRLPLSGEASPERSAALRASLLAAGTDAPTHVQAGAIWLRLSAAAYNDIEDYEQLAEIVARALR